MGKSSIKISGLNKLEQDLNKMQKNVAANSKKGEGKLTVDIDLISKNIETVNSLFGSQFTADSTDDDFANFFSERYQEIVIDGIFESNYNPKNKFNSKFNPYSKIS